MINRNKRKKNKKNSNIGRKMNYIIMSCFCISIFFIFSKSILAVHESQPNQPDIVLYKNQNPIHLENILQNNLKNVYQKELTIEETDLEYTTIYKNNDTLPKGTMQVLQEGRDGKQRVVVVKQYENNNLISEEIVANHLTKASINKIIEIGTGSGTNSYKPVVGDKVYVTSDTLAIRLNPDIDSEKVATIQKEDEVTILAIYEDWFYISSTTRKGYIPQNCVTNIAPNMTYKDTEEKDSYSKETLLKNLNFTMPLNVESHFTLNQFKKVLSGNDQDKNKVLEDNAEYFYYAEKQYKMNGIFLAAVAIHESDWGTSRIALDKKNLFGYGAYDTNPYGGSYQFSTYAEGIDLLARVFVKYYLNPSGTKIYDGNVATGKFYSGNTLNSINQKYASDANWAKSVYHWMTYLYNRL